MLDRLPNSRRQRWTPEYETADRKHLFNIPTEQFKPLLECPVSYITAESRQMLAQINIIDFAVRAAGSSVSLHGPALADWPSREVETLIAFTSETNKIENARLEAERAHAVKPLVTLETD